MMRAKGMWLTAHLLVFLVAWSAHSEAGAPIVVGERDIHEAVQEAPPYSTLIFDRSRSYTLSEPLLIDKPLTLRGLNARLPDDLAGTPLIFVTAEGFKISDFELHGNTDTLPEDEGRCSLLVISAGDFVVQNGLITNSTQHGVLISSSLYHRPQTFLERWGGADSPSIESGVVENGVVRDLITRGVSRDGVSLTGRNGTVRHVLIENIRGFGPSDRGPVEVADGSENVTVRNVYAEDVAYALDIMHDHGDQNGDTEINLNHHAENIHAVRCRWVVRTRNRPLGHVGLTLRDITAENCDTPVQVSNIAGVRIDGVRVIDHEGDGPLLDISNVRGLELSNVSLLGGALPDPPIYIRDSNYERMEPVFDMRRGAE